MDMTSTLERDEDRASLVEAVEQISLRLPSTAAAVMNAVRLREFRQSLADRGAFTVDDLARGLGMKRGTAQKWLERHVKAGRLFTVKVDGRVLVPASLLDEAFDPIEAWEPTRVPMFRFTAAFSAASCLVLVSSEVLPDACPTSQATASLSTPSR